jgi:hypothetical protein
MKLTRSTYCDSPCWQASARWLNADIDWNTRWPFGTSMGIHLGPDVKSPGFLLDLNAPLGEPNRLYLFTRRWHVTFGLISWWTFRETGREGRMVHGDYVRRCPHLVTMWPGGWLNVTRKQRKGEG